MSNKHRKNLKSDILHSQIKRDLTYLLPASIIFAVSVFVVLNFTSKIAYAEEILVYKSPTCGCCKKWVKHLKNEGFDVTTKNVSNVKPIKNEMGVESKFQSCHTVKVGKYFIEGHVSASDIKKLLNEKPDIKGLAVPGMPMGFLVWKDIEKLNITYLQLIKTITQRFIQDIKNYVFHNTTRGLKHGN